MKEKNAKTLQTTPLGYFSAKSILISVPLTVNKVKKTKHENFNFAQIYITFGCSILEGECKSVIPPVFGGGQSSPHKVCLKVTGSYLCVYVTSAKSVRLQHKRVLLQCYVYLEASSRDYLVASDKHVRILFGSWFRIPLPKEQKLKNKLPKNFISSRDGPEIVQKQGRVERTQEDYPTSAVYFLQLYRVVFLRSFISALFLYYFQVHLNLK